MPGNTYCNILFLRIHVQGYYIVCSELGFDHFFSQYIFDIFLNGTF